MTIWLCRFLRSPWRLGTFFIASHFTVAAYGQVLAVHAANAALSGTSEAAFKSNLGYSGEQWDASLRMQNLRARAYDPSSGRFIGLDPFAGNTQDAQSLHKYAYVHGDPVNGIDPTGMFLGAGGLAGLLISTTIGVVADNSHNIGVAVNGGRGLYTAGQIANFLAKFQKLYRIFEQGYSYYEVARDIWGFLDFDWQELYDLKMEAAAWFGEIQTELGSGGTSPSSAFFASARADSLPGVRSGRFFTAKLGIPLAATGKVQKIRDLAVAAGRLAFVSEAIAEVVAGRVAREFGFESADVTLEGSHGIDQLRRHTSLQTWMVLESKAGKSGFSTSQYGRQMSGRWIDSGIEQIIRLSGPTADATDLQSHYDARGRMVATVSRFNVNRKSFQIGITSAIHKIGSDEVHLRSWPRGT